MRSNSETKQGVVLDSKWCSDTQDNYKLRINLRVRETIKPDGERCLHNDVTILVKEGPSNNRSILHTDFGPVCLSCKTSDYLKTDRRGEWFAATIIGYTCTRCGAATLKP